MAELWKSALKAFAAKYLGGFIFAVVGLMGFAPADVLAYLVDGVPVAYVRLALLALMLTGAYLVLRQAFPAATDGDELWTFWRAHSFVAAQFGDTKNKDGHYPGDALMQRAARGDVYTEGAPSSGNFTDSMGLNSSPRTQIPKEFWAQNEMPTEGYLGGDEAAARLTVTKRRDLGHYDYIGHQYLDVHVRASDLKRINWRP